MKLYRIDARVEDRRMKTNEELRKIAKNNGRGRATREFVRKFNILNHWFKDNFFNHGNVVAHLFDVVYDQINKKGDQLAFGETSPNGRSLNDFLSRGLYFPAAIIKDYVTRLNEGRLHYFEMAYGYYFTGLVYIWERDTILNGGLDYVYYDDNNPNPLPSYTHKREEGPAYELRVTNRIFLPAPKYIGIGASVRQFVAENRMDMDEIINFTKIKYPTTTLVHMPHIRFQSNKGSGETGNHSKGMNCYRIMEIIYGIECGWYDHIKRVIE